MEDLAVGLVQSDHILLAFEYLNLRSVINICIKFLIFVLSVSGDGDLVSDLRAAPPEGSLPPDADHGPRAVLYRHGLVIIRVAEDDVGDPDQSNLDTELLCQYTCVSHDSYFIFKMSKYHTKLVPCYYTDDKTC